MRTPSTDSPADPSTVRLLLAFAAVYFIWGSTYLAIRFAIETIPPLLMAGVRFLVAGGILYAWARAHGAPRPTGRQWRDASIAAVLMLIGGNGAVVLAEQWVPSGLAALIVSAVPLWMVLLDWRWGARSRPTRRVMIGLVAGFGGVALLAGSPGVGKGGVMEIVGAVMLLGGGAFWAAGSLFSRYAPRPKHPGVWVATQMLTGGVMFMVISAAVGELGGLDLGGISLKSALALVYLIIFGALVAYSAYVWLLIVSTPARAGTYAYVNPVVAMVLGWALAAEPLSPRSIVAAVIIVGSVVIITTESRERSDARA